MEFMNILKNLSLDATDLDNPKYSINEAQVGALISKVRITIPPISKMKIFLNLGLRASSLAAIMAKTMHTAPLIPPQTKRRNSLKLIL